MEACRLPLSDIYVSTVIGSSLSTSALLNVFLYCCDCDVVILWHMDFRMIVVVRYELERNYFRLMSVFNRLESWNLILQDSKTTLSL